MLVLRKEQMEMLGKRKLPVFFDFICKYIVTQFPEFSSEKGDSLSVWVEEIYYEAKAFGFNTQREHVKYINYKCILGEDFIDKYEFAETILSSDYSPKLKLSKLKDEFLHVLRDGR